MANLVRLTSVSHEYEAGLICAELDQQGIENHLVGGALADFRAECPGTVDVMVREVDRSTAEMILSELPEETSQIDWDEVDVGESESPIEYECDVMNPRSESRGLFSLIEGPLGLGAIIVVYLIVKRVIG